MHTDCLFSWFIQEIWTLRHPERARIASGNDLRVKIPQIAVPEPRLANPSFCAVALGSAAIRSIWLIRRLTIPTHSVHWPKIFYISRKFLEKKLGWKIHPWLGEIWLIFSRFEWGTIRIAELTDIKKFWSTFGCILSNLWCGIIDSEPHVRIKCHRGLALFLASRRLWPNLHTSISFQTTVFET